MISWGIQTLQHTIAALCGKCRGREGVRTRTSLRVSGQDRKVDGSRGLKTILKWTY